MATFNLIFVPFYHIIIFPLNSRFMHLLHDPKIHEYNKLYSFIFEAPNAPENLQVKLDDANCSRVMLSWNAPKNLQFASKFECICCTLET